MLKVNEPESFICWVIFLWENGKLRQLIEVYVTLDLCDV